MKKKRKNHNHRNRAQKFFNAKTRVWTWESEIGEEGDQICYAEKNMGMFWKPLAPDIVRRVLNESQNWCICVRLVRDYGSDYRVDNEVYIIWTLKLNDLDDLYERVRRELIEPVKTSDIYDVGWLAETFISTPPDDNDQWHLKCLNPKTRVTHDNKLKWRGAHGL